MKKIFAVLLCMLLILMPTLAIAEPATPAATGEIVTSPTEPLTWDYLVTVGGCAVFVLIVVQMTKEWMDKLIKIPTAWYAYILAVITMLLATAFTSGLSISAGVLTLFNGWIVAATASRTYDAMAGK